MNIRALLWKAISVLVVATSMALLGAATAREWQPSLLAAGQHGAEGIYAEAWHFDERDLVAQGTLEGLTWRSSAGFASGAERGGDYLSPPLLPEQRPQAVVVEWSGELGAHEDEHEAHPFLFLRWRNGEQWSEWVEISTDEDGTGQSGQFSTPVVVPSPDALQWRLSLPAGGSLRSLTLGTVLVPEGDISALALRAVPLPGNGPSVIPRSVWGTGLGEVRWKPEKSRPRAIVIHHTATSQGGSNPAEVVRAIDVYHRETRDWGDIGYHYLIDHQGNIYTGRLGGPESVGAHAYDYNQDTVGIALVGRYGSSGISPAARGSLIRLVAWLGDRYGIDPVGKARLNGRLFPSIIGHRDTGRKTDCPGTVLWNELPSLRRWVAEEMAGGAPIVPPGIQLAPDTEWVSGSITVTVAPAGPPAALTLYLAGVPLQSGTGPYSVSLDSRTLATGAHELVAVATAGEQSARASRTFYVDNKPPDIFHVSDIANEGVTVNLSDGESGLVSVELRRRASDGNWGEWESVERFPSRLAYRHRSAFDANTALQWRATDAAGNSIPSGVIERP